MEKEEPRLMLTDYFEIAIIELPKAVKAYKENSKDELLQWMMFLDNPENKEVTQIMEENKDIKAAKEELEKISQDDILRRRALSRTLDIADRIQFAEDAEKRGKALGKVERNKEIAKKLKEMGLSINQIIEATDLSQEEIEKL